MSIKLELDATSIKKAITNHISNQGFDLAGKTVEVALVNGRGGNGNRATVTISDNESIIVAPPSATNAVSDTASEIVAKDVKEIANAVTEAPVEEDISNNTDQSMYLEQDMSIADDIMAAAENSADPFGEDNGPGSDSLFPSVNPGDVEAPKSLF